MPPVTFAAMLVNCCPYCGSTDIVLREKGYSATKGLLGIVSLGLIGGLAGFHNSKKLQWHCPRCNHKFTEPAQKEPFLYEQVSADALLVEPAKPAQPQKPAHVKSAPPVVKQRIICTCGAYNSIYNKTCFSCGAALSLATSTKVPAMPNNVVICQCGAKNALTHKHCIACGVWLDYSQLQQQAGQITYQSQQCPSCGADTPAKSRKVHNCAHCGQPL